MGLLTRYWNEEKMQVEGIGAPVYEALYSHDLKNHFNER